LDRLDDFAKYNSEKKTILNLPTGFDDPKKRKNLDEEMILDALEKMRDYIAQ
jgi:hypothetical protein